MDNISGWNTWVAAAVRSLKLLAESLSGQPWCLIDQGGRGTQWDTAHMCLPLTVCSRGGLGADCTMAKAMRPEMWIHKCIHWEILSWFLKKDRLCSLFTEIILVTSSGLSALSVEYFIIIWITKEVILQLCCQLDFVNGNVALLVHHYGSD